MNTHFSNTEDNMQELNIHVNVVGMEEELCLDVAGFDCVGDLETAIEDEVEEFNESNMEYCAETQGWTITSVAEDSDVSWLFRDSVCPSNWEWEWIELLGSNSATHDVSVCQAALELGIPADSYEEAYQGEYLTDKDFAEDYAEQVGALVKGGLWPNDCIDWEMAARDLMFDFTESGGHYFRIM